MNKTQLEYAVRRLDQVYSNKVAAIQAKTAKTKTVFNGKDFVAAVKSGKLRLDKYWADREITPYTNASSVFINFHEVVKTDTPKDKIEERKPYAALDAEHLYIKDQLYLGDAKEALALIEAFAAKKP